MDQVNSSDAKTTSSSGASTSPRKRVPSKSVRQRKNDRHREHVSKHVMVRLSDRLDAKRLISDEDLAEVFAELDEIVKQSEEEPLHTSECSYYMRCLGHECSCKEIVEFSDPTPCSVELESPMTAMVAVQLAEEFPVDGERDIAMMEKLIVEATHARIKSVESYVSSGLGSVYGTHTECMAVSDSIPRPLKILVGQYGIVCSGGTWYFPTTDYSGSPRLKSIRNHEFRAWYSRLRELHAERMLPFPNTIRGSLSMMSKVSMHGPPLSRYERCGYLDEDAVEYIYWSHPTCDRHDFSLMAMAWGIGYKRSNVEFHARSAVPVESVHRIIGRVLKTGVGFGSLSVV